jgi:hypothetical protein
MFSGFKWPFGGGGGGAAAVRKRGCELAPTEAPPGLQLATFGGGCAALGAVVLRARACVVLPCPAGSTCACRAVTCRLARIPHTHTHTNTRAGASGAWSSRTSECRAS